MVVQMKSCFLKPLDPTFVLSFLQKFKSACDSNGVYEEAAMWLFPYFLKELAKAALSNYMMTQNSGQTHFEGKLTTYCQVVNYMLETYTADNVIVEIEPDINRFKQAADMSAVRFSELLWEKVL